MMSQLQFAHDRLDVAGDAMVFQFRLKNDPGAITRILGLHVELWQTADTSGNRERRVGELKLDAQLIVTDSQYGFKSALRPGEETPLRLVWPTTPEALQAIEDYRAGMSPVFRIRPILMLEAVWPNDGPRGKWRNVCGWDHPMCGNGWPLWLTIPDREWIALLNRLNFKHNTLDRLKWPALPPAFKRWEENLAAAWQYHRTGDFDAALNACYKAFDCLGFNLTGSLDVKRREVLQLLMEGAEDDKKTSALELLKSLQNFLPSRQTRERCTGPHHLRRLAVRARMRNAGIDLS